MNRTNNKNDICTLKNIIFLAVIYLNCQFNLKYFLENVKLSIACLI